MGKLSPSRRATTSRRLKRHVFRPDCKPGAIINGNVNDFSIQDDIVSKQGDVSRFHDLMARLLPNERDREICVSYMAGIIQYQGIKSQWATLLQGVEGNGKTFLTRIVKAAVGKKYTHMPKADDIDNKFNAWMVGSILVGVEDIHVSSKKGDVLEALKPMITSYDGLEVQKKGRDQVTMDICANFMFNSNHKDAIRKTKKRQTFLCSLYGAAITRGCCTRWYGRGILPVIIRVVQR